MFKNAVRARVRHFKRMNGLRHHRLRRLRTLPAVSRNSVVAVIVVRDECLRIPDRLRHHRELGVDRFVVIDNGSTDGTTDYLCDQPDVDVLFTDDSYAEADYGLSWQQYVVSQYGFGRWYLLVDADELLVYDGMDELRLAGLCELLRRHGSEMLHATMIDMYPRGSVQDLDFEPGDSMIAACPYFDGSSYFLAGRSRRHLMLRGGPRYRLLSKPGRPFANDLNKYPLVKSVDLRTIHNVSTRSKRSPSGALLHFKLLDDISQRVEKALKEGQHWRDGIEWKAYRDELVAMSEPYYEGSMRYEGPDSLRSMRLISALRYDE